MNTSPLRRALLRAWFLALMLSTSARAEWITLQVPLARASHTFSLWEVAPGAASPATPFPADGPGIAKTSLSSITFIGGSFDAQGNWLPDQNSYALLQAERGGTGDFWLRDTYGSGAFAPRNQTALTAAPWSTPGSNAVFRQFSIESARAGHGLSLQIAGATTVTTFTLSQTPPQVEYDVAGQPSDLGFFLAWVPDTGANSGAAWIIDHDTHQRTTGTALPSNLAGAAWEDFTGTTPTHQVMFLVPSADFGDQFTIQIPGVSMTQVGVSWWGGMFNGDLTAGMVVMGVVGQNYWFQLNRLSDGRSGPGFRMGDADMVIDASGWMPALPYVNNYTFDFSIPDLLANLGPLVIRYPNGDSAAVTFQTGSNTFLYSWDDFGNQLASEFLVYSATLDLNRVWWVEQQRGGGAVNLGQGPVLLEGWTPSHLTPPAGTAYAWVPAVRENRELRSSEGWIAGSTGNTATYSIPNPVGGAPVTWEAILLSVNISDGTAPFTLSDPVAGDISPPSSPDGNSNFSTWFPSQPLFLNISATRWSKNLVIRTPLGERPIVRHQMQGDWSQDAATGQVWFNPYGYFDATATAYEGLPWWLVDKGVPGHPASEVLTPAADTTNDFIAATDNTNSDSDSLFDWEERLLGTNPYSADTDGDGINDDVDANPRARSGTAPGSTLKVYTQLRQP